MQKEQAKDRVKQLVEKYNRFKEEGRLKTYNEEQTKKDFIEPLFAALGWDVHNERADDEVTTEVKISKGRVDYAFRIDGIPKFFLEAKGLKEDLDNIKFAEQAINYAWHKGVVWAILTDFESLKIFNSEWKGSNIMQSHFITLHCREYLDQFDRLWLLSRESFLNDELSKVAESVGKKHKKVPVDEQLLADMNNFRESLSKNIVKNNSKQLTQDDIDEAVQRILDRLIFIRTAEDRELEEVKLLSIVRERGNRKLQRLLNEVFRYFDENYDSKLFAYYDGLPHICETLAIDDDVLEKVIIGLYQTKDNTIHYNFAFIDADILGNIYEQYLGRILKKTEKRAKLEEGMTHRKAQGIYYTPTYIVDFIVQSTVGELANDKKFDISKIKVLDPACGSGSFLLKTFDFLEHHHAKKGAGSQQMLDQHGPTATFSKKVEILKNNIFGVDLDPKAVEIAQLNLLLKAAEKKHRLPMLQNSIKCGNSVIDDPLFTPRPFKWEEQFKDVLSDGGFDVVIGNPPYVSMERMKEVQPFFEQKYPDVFAGKSDILYYFIVKGLQLLRPGGYLGMIVSRYFMDANFADRLRKYILANGALKRIIDFRNVQVFKGANVLTAIIILQKKKEATKFEVVTFQDDCTDPSLALNQIRYGRTDSKCKIDKFVVKSSDLTSEPWLFKKPQEKEIVARLSEIGTELGQICEIGKGMETGLNEVFVVTPDVLDKQHIEKELIRKRIKNGDLRRFEINFIAEKDRWLIYTELIKDIDKYPNTKKYLLQFEKPLKSRANYKLGNCEWFKFTCPLNKEIFESDEEKILVPFMATENRFAYDPGGKHGSYVGLTDTCVLRVKADANVPTKYLIGLLNSQLLEFVHHRMSKLKRDNYYEYFSKTLAPLPIIVKKEQFEVIEKIVTEIIELRQKINALEGQSDKKQALIVRVKELESELDRLVYKIYGLSKEEIAIVEAVVQRN